MTTHESKKALSEEMQSKVDRDLKMLKDVAATVDDIPNLELRGYDRALSQYAPKVEALEASKEPVS